MVVALAMPPDTYWPPPRSTWACAPAASMVGENGEVPPGEAMAKVAADKLPSATGEDTAFYDAKRKTAAFYIDRVLPQVGALLATIKSGKASLMALEDAAF